MKRYFCSKSNVAFRGLVALLLACVFSSAHSIEPVDLDGVWFKVNQTFKGLCEDNQGSLVSNNDRESGYLLLSYTIDPTYHGIFFFPDEFGVWEAVDAELSLVIGNINSGVLRFEPDLLGAGVVEAETAYYASVTGTERNGVMSNVKFKTLVGFEYVEDFIDTCLQVSKVMAKSITEEKVPAEVLAIIP